MYKIAQNYMLQ